MTLFSPDIRHGTPTAVPHAFVDLCAKGNENVSELILVDSFSFFLNKRRQQDLVDSWERRQQDLETIGGNKVRSGTVSNRDISRKEGQKNHTTIFY
jgi:hypothetical protein